MLYMVKAQTKFLSAKLASGRQNITKCVQGNKFKFTHKPIVKTFKLRNQKKGITVDPKKQKNGNVNQHKLKQ